MQKVIFQQIAPRSALQFFERRIEKLLKTIELRGQFLKRYFTFQAIQVRH